MLTAILHFTPYTLHSQFWHLVTPSNTLQLTWQNVLLGRLADTPVSVQMEVWPSGRFTYRYDLSRLDVNEIANIVTGASFGGLEWATNTIPANITSLSFHALAVEDSTDPDKDGDGLATIDEIFVYGTDPGAADTDGDGLSDPDELTAGTDPWNPDTDNDGLVDGEEIEIGANPFSGDSDADGVGDWSEVYEHGTSPTLADTDADGLLDAEEIAGTTDPTKADTDDDGLDDAAESQHGTNPNNPDTDGDGAPDGWEVVNGSNPLVADTDGDGLADGVEMRLGSSPLLEDSDGDGFDDFEEFVSIGTSPALADTDGDGLSDWLEVDLMRVMPTNSWVAVCAESNATVFAATQNDIDDSIATTNLPFVVEVFGVGCDRISIDTNGKVHLIPTNGTAITEYDYHNKSPSEVTKNGNDILVAAYWDDLMLSQHLASSICIGTDENGEKIVIGYDNVGLYGNADTNAALTCQIVLSSDTNFPIRINYQTVVTNMAGESATIGVFDRRTSDYGHPGRCRSLVWSYEEDASITNGLSVGFRFGVCTDPLNFDTDDDGLNDGEEFSVGTDPLNPDTDNDGVTDGQEVENSSDPNDDTDGGRPASRVPVAFNFGDPSGSHSEKYRLVVKPEKNPNGQKPDSGEEPKTFEWVNAEYGECETKTAMLLRGWTYEVRLFHAGTDPEYDSTPRPDYDYSLTCIPPSCIGVVTNDPQRLFGENSNSGDTFEADGKKAEILVLDGCIVGDYDSKDGFTNHDLSRVYRNKPLRHWINDDDDDGDINENDEDIPGVQDPSWLGEAMYAVGIGKEPDYSSKHVDGKCDILDFTPVWIDMGFALQQLTTLFEGSSASDYALTLSQPEGAVNIVWTSLTTNNVSQFLATSALEDAETVQLTEEETRVPSNLISAMLENRAKGIFLFEGRALENESYYGTKYITLRCYRKPYTPGEGNHLFELKLPISISPVENMFRWIDERWVCGDTNSIPSRTCSPWNNPDAECDGRHFIFVHGYDVNAQSARGWASEMFKRLWQSGSRSKFTAVDWYGNDSQIPGWVPKYGGEAPNYYANVEHAFATASRFVEDCSSLTGQKIILAHSLGNVLVSSAIKDHGLTDYSKYYMLNAAVPMEAYDGEVYSAAMIDHDWRGVTNSVYSANWHQVFDADDGRARLTWRDRFMGIANAINCYSTSEDTLGNAGLNEWLVGRWWRDKYWAMQELNKGTAYAAAAPESWMHCEGGWGYNPYYATNSWYVTWPNRRMTDRFRKAILKLTDDDLKRHPVFRPFDENWLFTTNAVAPEMVKPVRSRILADGVPATSFAAGRNPLSANAVHANLNYATFMPADWPRRDRRWRHSDIKRVAFFFTQGLFKRIVEGDNR